MNTEVEEDEGVHRVKLKTGVLPPDFKDFPSRSPGPPCTLRVKGLGWTSPKTALAFRRKTHCLDQRSPHLGIGLEHGTKLCRGGGQRLCTRLRL